MKRTFATADGRRVETAYANAWDGDSRMEGMRVGIMVQPDGEVTATVHPDDHDATAQWSQSEIDAMLKQMVVLAKAGDIEMIDEREMPTWLI